MIQLFVPHLRRWRRALLALAATLALAVLVWLFIQADSISIEQHHDYTKKLFLLQETDAQLNAAILATRYGLHQDLALSIEVVRMLVEVPASLHQPLRFLTDRDQEQLIRQAAL